MSSNRHGGPAGAVAAALIAAAAHAPAAPPAGPGWDELIARHGEYSRTYRDADWSTLGTGKDIADKAEADYQWQNVIGQKARKRFDGGDVVLRDLAYRVRWEGDRSPLKVGRLFSFHNCDSVTIENVAVVQEDRYKGRFTFWIQNCRRVLIRNCFISGSVCNRHINIRGAEYVLIENCEVEGRDYDGNGKYEGAGAIFIYNGEYVTEPPAHKRSGHNLQFTVVQNCYVHDFDDRKHKKHYPEGITVVSPADGIVFNCYIDNYRLPGANNAMQVTTRRCDDGYGEGHVFRIERCITKRCTYNKQGSVWYQPPPFKNNHIIWANNLYYDLNFAMDHKADFQHHVNQTWIMNAYAGPAYRIWGCRAGYVLYNSIYYYAPELRAPSMFHRTPGKDKDDKRKFVTADYNLYYMKTPGKFYQNSNSRDQRVPTWRDWQALEKDLHSTLTDSGSLFRSPDPDRDDYRLAADSIARAKGGTRYYNHEHPGLRVRKDFYGRPLSPTAPDLGAYQFAPEQ